MFRSGSVKKIYEAIGTKPSDNKVEEWLIENRIEESEDWPLMKNSGAKAAMVVNTATVTGHITSSAPRTAACIGGMPSSMCR